MCNCKNHVHTFKCFIRNIADAFTAGKDNR
jgi:hypothetical protein